MELQQTAEAQHWLNQFDPADRPTGALLLSTLRLISADAFDNEIFSLVDDIQRSSGDQVALYAVREPDGTPYFADRRRRAQSIDSSRAVGSEAAVAGRITQIKRASPSNYLDHPSLSQLKKSRCRQIVVIDDLVGSGFRVLRFLQWMLEHPSLRSWRSFGWIRFTIVTYGATSTGMRFVVENMRGKRSGMDVTFLNSERPIVGADLLTPTDLDKVSDLCERYGAAHRIPWKFRTGFFDTLCLAVFAHGSPNNIPGILWETTRTWRPLFPNRTIPQPLRAVFNRDSSRQQQADILASLGKPAIAKHRWFSRGTEQDRRLLLLLAALRKKVRRISGLSRMTDLSRFALRETVDEAIRIGLIDRFGLLTPSGLHALRIAERVDILPEQIRINKPYYPSTLRGGQAGI